jgi:hypothetical protein
MQNSLLIVSRLSLTLLDLLAPVRQMLHLEHRDHRHKAQEQEEEFD